MKRPVLGVTLLMLLTMAAMAQVNDVNALRSAAAPAAAVAAPADDCSDERALLDDSGTPATATESPLSFFGAGIGAISSLGDDRVEAAEVVNNVIVVTQDDDATLGPIMEAHALVFGVRNLWALRDRKGRLYVTSSKPCEGAEVFPTVAHGPFVAMQLDSDQLISALGVGWMVGFRMKQSNSSLNVGLAYTLENEAKTLADGFEEGKPLPSGQTAIQFHTGRGSALALVVSFGF